jgi:hypothetical protein
MGVKVEAVEVVGVVGVMVVGVAEVVEVVEVVGVSGVFSLLERICALSKRLLKNGYLKNMVFYSFNSKKKRKEKKVQDWNLPYNFGCIIFQIPGQANSKFGTGPKKVAALPFLLLFFFCFFFFCFVFLFFVYLSYILYFYYFIFKYTVGSECLVRPLSSPCFRPVGAKNP